MQILDIILYGEADRVRRLSLRPGELNIVTGASKTGKSALITVVEYCLGRSECDVPAGVITDNVRWYALRLQMPKSQIFVARRAPKLGYKSSGDIFFAVGVDLAVPSQEALQPNVNPADLNKYLTRAMGVSPNLNVPPEDQRRLPLEATLRHALLLCFQQQSEIANQNFLFHRQGEDHMPQTMRDTFPYFLGAVDEERLGKVAALREAKRELVRAERKIQGAKAVRGAGHTRGLVLMAEAEEVGLLKETAVPGNLGELRETLGPVLEWKPEELPSVPGDVVARLQDERSQLLAEMRRYQDQIRAARSCADGQKGFAFEAREQQSRLSSLGLFPSEDHETVVCPVCASTLDDPPPSAADLQRSLVKVSDQLNSVATEQPRLREFIDGLEASLGEVRQSLADNRSAMNALISATPSAEEHYLSNSRTNRVVGRIELYLESLSELGQGVGEETDIGPLRAGVEELEADLAGAGTEELLPSFLNIISQRMAAYAKELGLEYSDVPLRLDMARLDVVADTEQGPIPMKRMGSGANWVGYHLAAHIALHHWFVSHDRPVPRFVFFDQPTQVYYPQEIDDDGAISVLDEDDRAEVRRMFQWLLEVTRSLAPNLQVIVTDHADIPEPWFQDQIVERWRGGEKLVPASWIE